MPRRLLASTLLVALASTLAVPGAHAQEDDQPIRHGRKYKAPPDTTHIEVVVTKHSNGKPVVNAAVVFHPMKNGKDQGNLEVKTDPDGKAVIDVIPVGSSVRVQVIASGYATFAEDYQLTAATKSITVSMLRPQEQISAYEDNSGKTSTRQYGVQEPVKPDTQQQPATPPKPTPDPPANPAPVPHS